MINKLRLELEDVGPINKADIDINKINIIGGQNSTGKSTASKLLYCFLMVNSSDREKLIIQPLKKELHEFYMALRYERRGFPIELANQIDLMRRALKIQDYFDFEEIIGLFNELKPLYYESMFNNGLLASDGQLLDEKAEALDAHFQKIERIIMSVQEEGTDFFREVMADLLSSEFDMDMDYKSRHSPEYEISNAKLYDSLDNSFSFEIKFKDQINSFVSEGVFNVSNVFYFESYSIFDIFSTRNFDNSYHVNDLKEHLFPKRHISRMFEDESMGKLEDLVDEIVGGRIVKSKLGTLQFESNNSNFNCSIKNTASGVKQIAVIQTLLKNRFLTDNSVLIMDEPEVNLHPEWQIKLARILVLLAKEGNITIYINSHSPLFINAIEAYTEYYDMQDDTNFYLTRPADLGKSYFEKIDADDLYEIYDELGQPYHKLNILNLEKRY